MLRCELSKANSSYAADTTATRFIAGAELSLSAVEFIAFARFRIGGAATGMATALNLACLLWPSPRPSLTPLKHSTVFGLPKLPGASFAKSINAESVEIEISFQFFQWANSI